MKPPRGSRDSRGSRSEPGARGAADGDGARAEAGEDDEHGADPELRAMRRVWHEMREQEPPAAGMSALLAAARAQAVAMQPRPTWRQRMLAALRRPPVLALATVVVLIGGAVLFTRRLESVSPAGAPMSAGDRAREAAGAGLEGGAAPRAAASAEEPAPTEAAAPAVAAEPESAAPTTVAVPAPATVAVPAPAAVAVPAPAAVAAPDDMAAAGADRPVGGTGRAATVSSNAGANAAALRRLRAAHPTRGGGGSSSDPEPGARDDEVRGEEAASAGDRRPPVPSDPGARKEQRADATRPSTKHDAPMSEVESPPAPPAARAVDGAPDGDAPVASDAVAAPGGKGAGSERTADRRSPRGPSEPSRAAPGSLYEQCEVAAARGDCAAVRRLVDQITSKDPGYRSRVAKDSAVARCLSE